MFRRAAFACVVASLCAVCACSSRTPAGPPVPAAVDPHVVTNDHCTVIELRLDGGVVKNVCLTADQIEKVIEQ